MIKRKKRKNGRSRKKKEVQEKTEEQKEKENSKNKDKTTPKEVFKSAMAISGFLVTDNLLGIGVADDIAIPFVLIGGAVAAEVVYIHNQFENPTDVQFIVLSVASELIMDQFAHKPKKQSTGKSGSDSHEAQYIHGGKKRPENPNKRKGTDKRRNNGREIN